jgi:hypothetical protein
MANQKVSTRRAGVACAGLIRKLGFNGVRPRRGGLKFCSRLVESLRNHFSWNLDLFDISTKRNCLTEDLFLRHSSPALTANRPGKVLIEAKILPKWERPARSGSRELRLAPE